MHAQAFYPSALQEIHEAFAFCDDWEERYGILIDLGRRLPPFPEEARTDANRVNGCASQVWMIAEPGARFKFQADSDAQIVRGLIAILRAAYHDQDHETLKQLDMVETFRELGLENHLTPNRRNGFFAMTERLRELAQ